MLAALGEYRKPRAGAIRSETECRRINFERTNLDLPLAEARGLDKCEDQL